MSDTTVASVKAAPITTTEVVKPSETTGSTASTNPTNTANPANSTSSASPINPADPTTITNPADSVNQTVSNPAEPGGSVAQGTPTPEQGKKLDVVA